MNNNTPLSNLAICKTCNRYSNMFLNKDLIPGICDGHKYRSCPQYSILKLEQTICKDCLIQNNCTRKCEKYLNKYYERKE